VKLLRQAKTDSFSGKAFFIFLIRFFPALANMLVLIYYSRTLDEAVYGTYQNYWVRTYVLSAIGAMGLQGFLMTYNAEFIAALVRKLSVRSYALGMLWIVLASAAFAYLGFYDAGIPLFISFFFLLAYIATIILESVHFVKKNFGFILLVNLLYTLCFCWLHYSAVANGFDMQKLLLYLLVVLSARAVIYILPVPGMLRQHSDVELDKPVSEIRKLWLHLGVYDVTQFLFKYVDKFIMSLVLTAELSAIYYNGSQDIPFLSLLLGAAGSAALMQLADKSITDKDAYTVSLLKRSSRLLSCIVFPVFFFFLIFRTELFTVLLSEKYIPAIPVFFVSVMAVPLRAYSFTTILQNRHKGGIINAGSVADIVIACALMYPLYLWLGLPGVALSFVVSSYLQGAFYLYHTSQLLGRPVSSLIPIGNWLGKLVVFGLLFRGVHYLLAQHYPGEIVLSCGVALTMVVSCVAVATEFKLQRNIESV
jgi:O-antigen/teichoic acid export membrane protein